MPAGGRSDAQAAGGLCFLFASRTKKPLAVRRWWPVVSAMPRMLRELQEDPALGLLGVTSTVQGRGSLMVQYWRDLDSLPAHAHDPEDEHPPPGRGLHPGGRAGGGGGGGLGR